MFFYILSIFIDFGREDFKKMGADFVKVITKTWNTLMRGSHYDNPIDLVMTQTIGAIMLEVCFAYD